MDAVNWVLFGELVEGVFHKLLIFKELWRKIVRNHALGVNLGEPCVPQLLAFREGRVFAHVADDYPHMELDAIFSACVQALLKAVPDRAVGGDQACWSDCHLAGIVCGDCPREICEEGIEAIFGEGPDSPVPSPVCGSERGVYPRPAQFLRLCGSGAEGNEQDGQ